MRSSERPDDDLARHRAPLGRDRQTERGVRQLSRSPFYYIININDGADMDTQQLRTDRARLGRWAIGRVGDRYQVVNLDNGHCYTVTSPSFGCTCCTCEDFAQVRVRCKHIEAVRLWLEGQINVQPITSGKETLLNWDEIYTQLSKPFPAASVHWRIVELNGEKTRARVMPYIDARSVIDRLNQVVGVGNWTDAFREVRLGDEIAVECTLTIHGVSRSDVGVAGSDEDGEDGPRISRAKTAYSDARKRAAVPFGIGRYLYDLGAQWVDYDAVDNRLLTRPFLPRWALPEDEQDERQDERQQDERQAQEGQNASNASIDELTKARARDVALPFGTRDHPEWKGKRLGELNMELIKWLAESFSPNTDDGRMVKKAAQVLVRAA